MPYATYHNGAIVTLANQPQGGEGEVWVDENSPDVVAFLTPSESFSALALRALDESASVALIAQLAPILPSIKLLAEAGTEKGIQAALLVLSGLPLPADLEDERQVLLQKLGG